MLTCFAEGEDEKAIKEADEQMSEDENDGTTLAVNRGDGSNTIKKSAESAKKDKEKKDDDELSDYEEEEEVEELEG